MLAHSCSLVALLKTLFYATDSRHQKNRAAIHARRFYIDQLGGDRTIFQRTGRQANQQCQRPGTVYERHERSGSRGE